MPTILVVDDDASILKLLQTALADIGEVVCAASGEEALAATAESVPDLVVLDVTMPGASGLDVLRQWRADPPTRDLEVVLLSGRDQPDDEAAGYDAGADAYVTKPVDVDVLESLLVTMLANRAAQKQAVLDEFRGLQVGEFPS